MSKSSWITRTPSWRDAFVGAKLKDKEQVFFSNVPVFSSKHKNHFRNIEANYVYQEILIRNVPDRVRAYS